MNGGPRCFLSSFARRILFAVPVLVMLTVGVPAAEGGVVHAAGFLHNKRAFDAEQIQFLTQIFLDVVLHCGDSFLCVLATQKRFVIVR